MPSKIIPNKFAVMTCDPGGTTACAQGVFRTDKGDDMVATIFKRAAEKRQIRSWEVRGDSEAQAWAICKSWSEFRFRCSVEYAIALPDIHFVIEDFALRELNAKLNSVEVIFGIKTLLRYTGVGGSLIRIELGNSIIAGCALEDGKVARVAPVLKKHKLIGKTPEEVMKFAQAKGWVAIGQVEWAIGRPVYQQPSTGKRCTNQRLRDLDIWVIGSEHERDARRHLVQKVSDIL